ncbi:tRNA (adenosine(37)-N6)-threonylcarbamoyltransferase complex ATPase subunit type 1 TsaE [Bacteriovorax sp. PP10]|jgi:tRNA threonylcarbamoyladenosine biosynthesis protein TsaE|uniref:tRNA threonylcarbamoyladenosine biosynthesis protein TsaE n=1 Tax=Bacteriovorax antarcticus TaxID=3088717 RepID=A0ABU5VTV5_9BACT|nr:tRNA (adenosine(37)-N6)-threonylcarbamoyltransferase complex ATPase subunit type 1 TsaE [Bacteriovorax sp. PP10]MEA9356482.1 tRNA (adenosine(37)-N6)-threonylcarbamoyltransferase complex ATPase subunit type 1 TsaE [Bacteriovorax sp. PP10]
MSVVRTWKKVLESDLANIALEMKEVIEPPSVIILDGPVGAGKTTFTKIFLDRKGTASPTYSIINEVDNLLHADLYRIEKKEELIHLEIPMYLEEKDYFLIEWGMPYLHQLQRIIGDEFKYYQLKIEINENNSRNFLLTKIT